MFTVLALFYHGASYPSLQKPLLPNGLFPPMERHCGTAFSVLGLAYICCELELATAQSDLSQMHDLWDKHPT